MVRKNARALKAVADGSKYLVRNARALKTVADALLISQPNTATDHILPATHSSSTHLSPLAALCPKITESRLIGPTTRNGPSTRGIAQA